MTYEDDGISFGYAEGSSLLRTFDLSASGSVNDLQITARGSYTPAARTLVIRMHHVVGRQTSVQLNDRRVEGWRYDATSGIVTVTASDSLTSGR